jgi:hypothetical protein
MIVFRFTIEDFYLIVPGHIFAHGEAPNSPDGLFMTDTRPGEKLHWLAKKGYNNDWAIYCHWAEKSWDFIEHSGDKVKGIQNIRNVFLCDDEMLSRYRL